MYEFTFNIGHLYIRDLSHVIHNLPVVTFIAFEWELGGNCVS